MRKGQDEIVGFVAVVVVVALALVFFIGFSLRNTPDESTESQEIKQFLESSAAFTSNCELGLRDKYANLEQLIENCHKAQTRCLDGRPVCQVYDTTMRSLLEKSWSVGSEKAVKGYILNVTYEATQTEKVISLVNGSCTGNFRAEERLSPDSLRGGTFVTTLKICT